MMKFVFKGTDAEWENALKGQELGSGGVVQIQSITNAQVKRKLNQDDVDKEAGLTPKNKQKTKSAKKSKR